MTICLPFEILTAIFEKVDDVRDLRHVRTASRTFCAVATPIAFRVLSVASTGGSAHNLGRLFDVPEIATYVREVAYCDTGVDGRKSISFQELKSVRTCAIPELASSLSRIHQLPRLETINLTFFPAGVHGVDFDDEGRLALQASILGALTDSFSIRAPSKLTSLSLHNLRTWDLTPLESAPFQAVLKNLRRLRLSVLYDHADDLFKSLDRWLHFWGTLFHRSILAPTQHTITELTLESHMIPAGALSGLSLVGLQFPHLCALSLRKIVFELSVGVESFILRHAATLACLELITCKLPLNTESNARPIHWAHIWDSFAEGLTALVALRVDETGAGESWERRYVRPAGVNYCGIHAPEHVNVADGAALRRFYATVSARSEEASKTFQGAEGGA